MIATHIGPRRHAALVLTAALFLWLPAAGRAAPPKPVDVVPPMVLIAAQGEGYRHLGKLPDTVRYATQLAIGLQKIGCQVHLTVDTASADGAKKALKAAGLAILPGDRPANGGKGVTLSETDDSTALQARLDKWMKDVAEAKPAIAHLVLTGHGEERAPAAGRADGSGSSDGLFFLTVGDKRGEGGVGLADVRRDAMAHPSGLPLVIIYDACQTRVRVDPPDGVGADAKPGAPAGPRAPAAGGADPSFAMWVGRRVGYQIVPELPSRDGTRAPTILYATRPGAVAAARGDLVSQLARGLNDKDDLVKFLTWAHPERKDKVTELSLCDWFLYAKTRQEAATGMKQSPLVVRGCVDLDTRVARLTGAGFAPPTARDVVIDLLAQYRPLQGDGLRATCDSDLVWTIQHPEGNALGDGQVWVSGAIGPPGGIDPTDRLLVVDYVSSFRERKGLPAPKATALGFHIQPSAEVKKTVNPNGYVELGNNMALLTASWNQTYRVKVPLRGGPDLPLNLLAFAAHKDMFRSALVTPWEPGGVLRVVGMKIEPQNPGKPSAAPNPLFVNLLSGVWAPYDLADAPGDGFLTVAPKDAPPGGYRCQLVKGKGTSEWARCGGLLRPRVYVPKGNVLYIEAKNTDPSNTSTLVIDLLHLDDATGQVKAFAKRATIEFKPGDDKPKYVELGEEGYANFLGLSFKGSGGLLVKGITLQADTRAKHK